jgi:hypothetical protein
MSAWRLFNPGRVLERCYGIYRLKMEEFIKTIRERNPMDGQENEGAGEPSRIVRPYDPSTHAITMLTSLEDILEFDRSVREITEGLPRPIRIGSVLRAGERAYRQWGIGITDQNRENLRELATWHYVLDAEEGKNECHTGDDLRHVKKKLSSDSLESMATYIARLVKEAAVTIDDGIRTFRVCNIASGGGRLCSAIATAMREDPESEAILERTEFHLVDHSVKISKAEKNLDGFGVRIVPHAMLDDQFLEKGVGEFDFIVELSHLHRKPFLSGHLAKLYSALRDGGLLISGDFHSITSQHPYYIYNLLKEMGVENWRLNRFDELLGPLCLGTPKIMRDGESEAVIDHYAYWLNLAAGMANRDYRGERKVRIIGAFTSSAQLDEALNVAGFCTDREMIRKAFPEARLPNKFPVRVGNSTDKAAVTVAARLARGG